MHLSITQHLHCSIKFVGTVRIFRLFNYIGQQRKPLFPEILGRHEAQSDLGLRGDPRGRKWS